MAISAYKHNLLLDAARAVEQWAVAQSYLPQRSTTPECFLLLHEATQRFTPEWEEQQNSTRRLKPEDVVEIRRLYAAGNTSFVRLGQQFGVSSGCINRLLAGKTYKHVIEE